MNWKTPEAKRLIAALLTLRTSGEAERFLRDLMTEGEIEEFAKRLSAADMLSQSVPYSTIVEKTGLSSTTVARVSKWLNGSEGGYDLVLNRLHAHTPPSGGRGAR